MPSVDLLASDVMNAAAAALNDAARSHYTYALQMPYLNMALRELQEEYELNDVPVTDETSSTIIVPAGTTQIGFNSTPPVPELPDDLIEPQLVWESPTGLNQWTPMTRVEVLPQYMVGVQLTQFVNYIWADQKIKVLPAVAIIDLKINYLQQLFITVTASSDALNVINALSFLSYRTAALIRELVEENPEGAASLNGMAIAGLDRALGITTKGRQSIQTRHRPFRAGYKTRGY